MPISLASTSRAGVVARSDDTSFEAVALLCCLGLVVSFGLITLGFDLAPVWI